MKFLIGILALALIAAPAFAGTLEDRVSAVEQQLAAQSAPSAREIQASVDAYLATAQGDATLVGGPGQAGYDGGFWIRGGTFLLKTNLTLQARYEYFALDDDDFRVMPGVNTNRQGIAPVGGSELSGFSLPRATLKFSGDATCDISYYLALEFGHVTSVSGIAGFDDAYGLLADVYGVPPTEWVFDDTLREGWIEWNSSPFFNVRMGLIQTAATRQLMTPAELQQFADISLASAAIGATMPGLTDRNRDYGLALHGSFGCDGNFSYLFTVTNGDGWGHRNVVDPWTSDMLAFSGRINWDIIGHPGYEEGALRQTDCGWVLAIGAWAHYYDDSYQEDPDADLASRFTWGLDMAAGYGGFSATAAFNMASWTDSDVLPDVDVMSYLVQVGYLFPGTAWEIAARYSAYTAEYDNGPEWAASEIAGAVNYYIDGHADKLTLDVSYIASEDDGNYFFYYAYAPFLTTYDTDGMLIRLQWQLAL
jgi:hypothetical protein